MRRTVFIICVFLVYLGVNIGNFTPLDSKHLTGFTVEICWAEGSYQKGKEETIAQALKRAEGVLKERALLQTSCSAKVERDSSRFGSQKSFLSDFSVNSPLTMLMGNSIGAPSPYICGLRGNWMEPLGENLYGMLGMKFGYITGDTTYHITFAGGASELEFPLDNFLLGIEGTVGYRSPYNENQDRARLTLWWLTDVENDAGKMKDSDWIDGDGHPGLDIYSESDAELDTNIFDINYICNYLPTEWMGIGAMFGYRYQKFEYEVSNTDQTGYGSYDAGYTTFVSGNTLDYEVKYNIWYLGLSTDLLFGDKFRLNLRGAYSPWADAEDIDDHLVRVPPKLSKGDCDGEAYFINLNANWRFLPDWLLQVSGEYMDIDTDGTQHQTTYNPYSDLGTVDDKITASLWLVSAVIKYGF